MKVRRVHLKQLYRHIGKRRRRGVGDPGPGSQFQSFGPHGESSLQAQRKAATTPSEVNAFVQGEAEAVRLAHEARPNDPTVLVDDEGFIIGADTTPEEAGVVNEPEVVITGTRTPSGGFARDPGPAPAEFGPTEPAGGSGSDSKKWIAYLLVGAAVTKAMKVW